MEDYLSTLACHSKSPARIQAETVTGMPVCVRVSEL